MTLRNEFVADLHIHSRYAYACSKNLTLEGIAATAGVKGIELLATGDFTHPAWLEELEANLVPDDAGTFKYQGIRFVLGTEISCVYRQGGKARRLHLLVFLPILRGGQKSERRFVEARRQAGRGRASIGRIVGGGVDRPGAGH